MKFEMSQLAEELGLPPRFLVTRDKGEVAFSRLATMLQTVADSGSLILRFSPDQIMDVSFADETIIRLGQAIVEGQYGHRRILLEGLSEDSIDNINAAIRLQRLKIAFFAIESNGEWKLVGHLEDSLREVLEMLSRRRSITSTVLAEELSLTLSSANNRLKRLYDQRLIQREYEISETGLIYIYHFWNWLDAE